MRLIALKGNSVASSLGTAWIQIKPSLTGVSNSIKRELVSASESGGTEGGKSFLSGFSAVSAGAIGGVVASITSKITSAITSNISGAIARVDTLANFPKVMSSLGFSVDEASSSVSTMSDRLDGLPTTLNGIVGDVQKLTATLGNLNTGTVNATSLGLALNDMFLAGGKGTQAASNAMEQYNQMLAAGKPDMQSWRSILDAAPGQLNQLAKTLLGATANQNDLYEALKNGTVRFDDLNAAIVRLDSEGGEGFESFEAQARAATGGLGTALENVQNRIGKAIAKVIDHIGSEKIAEAINGISAGFSGVADVVIGIVDFLSQNTWILDLITGFFVGLFAMGIASKVMGFFTMLTTFAATNPVVLAIGAISAVLFLIMTHLDEVGAFFETVFGAIGEFVGGVATVIGDFFGGVFDGIMAGVQAVGDFFNGVFTTIGAIVGGAFETVKNAAQGAWNFITGIFSGLANFFGSIFSGAWEAVKAVFSTGGQIFMGIVDGIANAFRTIVNAIIRGINFVVAIPFNAINGFLNILRGINILGFQPFGWIGQISVPQIPLLATGGKVVGVGTDTSDSNLVALSDGEYVIRAAAARQIGYDNLDEINETGRVGGGDVINNITINGYNKDPNELAEIISRKIAFAQRGVLA